MDSFEELKNISPKIVENYPSTKEMIDFIKVDLLDKMYPSHLHVDNGSLWFFMVDHTMLFIRGYLDYYHNKMVWLARKPWKEVVRHLRPCTFIKYWVSWVRLPDTY